MDVLRLIVEALSGQTASDTLTAAGIYIASPLATHIYLTFVKFDRRERGLSALGDWTARGIAAIGTWALALFVGWRLGGWQLEDAIDHATSIAIFYPFAMWMLMSWLKVNRPEAYRKLAPRRRRSKDGADMDDTTELFL